MNSQSLMVVEDDADIREALVDILNDEGFTVYEARNGVEALEHLRILETAELPCLIFVDLRMPLMDGWEFLAQQKLDVRLASIPVVVLSATAKAELERNEGILRDVRLLRK